MGHTAHLSKFIGLSSEACKQARIDLEGELLVRGQIMRPEPAQLAHVVRRRRLAREHARRPVEVQRRRRVLVLAVGVDLDRDEVERLDLEPRLLPELPDDRRARMLALLQEAAGEIPLALVRSYGAAREEDPPLLVEDDGARGRLRVRVPGEPAGRAVDPALAVRELRAAPGTPLPRTEHAHLRDDSGMSRRLDGGDQRAEAPASPAPERE